ncbi:hypothetical protein PPACK8108_LOCUS5615 [Phakopsora pachyrhizi]|uniref:Uncharacterized protein n=1 Tax=Phakopsora pachyrhizi TaxID=170000 RepID=A0AAV0ASM6_PHAPC|nr:hypothetical protein PPACK8108_LOCUS5615 [Phakopsora pachyrhizi]
MVDWVVRLGQEVLENCDVNIGTVESNKTYALVRPQNYITDFCWVKLDSKAGVLSEEQQAETYLKQVDISKLQKFSEAAEITNEDGIGYLFGTTGTTSKKLRGIEEPKRQIQRLSNDVLVESVKLLWRCKDLDDDLKAAIVSPGERITSSKHWIRGQGTLLEESSQNSNLRRNKEKYEMTDKYEEK